MIELELTSESSSRETRRLPAARFREHSLRGWGEAAPGRPGAGDRGQRGQCAGRRCGGKGGRGADRRRGHVRTEEPTGHVRTAGRGSVVQETECSEAPGVSDACLPEPVASQLRSRAHFQGTDRPFPAPSSRTARREPPEAPAGTTEARAGSAAELPRAGFAYQGGRKGADLAPRLLREAGGGAGAGAGRATRAGKATPGSARGGCSVLHTHRRPPQAPPPPPPRPAPVSAARGALPAQGRLGQMHLCFPLSALHTQALRPEAGPCTHP